jgi:predicted nucleotidyltransferase
MDFRRPVEAVIPGAQGRILAVLAETTAELNLRTIARLARVSPAQASRVLPELVTLGLVERREAPPSALFSLVDEHVGARAVRTLSRARGAVLEELGKLVAEISPRPASALVFGSFARGEADEASDLDILLVRPEDGDNDDRWVSSVEEFRAAARRLTGNSVQVLEATEHDVPRRLRSKTQVWHDIVRDGVLLHGKAIDDYRSRRSA